jgi:hypothetical protein
MDVLLQWFTLHSFMILGALFALYVLAFNKTPSVQNWQAFLDSFESKGGQLMLLWVTDMVVLGVLVHYWEGFSPTLQNFITGLISGINGAFLGALSAKNSGNGGGPSKPDTLKVGFVPAVPAPSGRIINGKMP